MAGWYVIIWKNSQIAFTQDRKEFWGKAMFLHVSVHLFKGGGAVPRVKAGGRQSTAKVSCILIMCFVLFLIFRNVLTKYLHMDLVYAFKNVETFKKELLVVFRWMK